MASSFRNLLGLPVKDWDTRAEGQTLIMGADKEHWEFADESGGVTSFNGRTGSVTPASGEYTFTQIDSKPTTLSGYGITDAVPSSRTVNSKPLSSNITLSASDVGAEPAITAGTAAQFVRGNKTVGNTIIGGGIGTFPGNNTAGTTAVCYEVGTDAAGRGASIKSRRGAASFYTGMVLSAHNPTGDLDLVSINDDSTVNFGSTLYIDEVNGRVGIGAAPTTYSFEVNSPTGGLFLNRQSTVLEPFILMRSNGDAATGGQIRSSTTGYGIRLTTPASGAPTMLGVSPTQVAPGFDNAASSATASLRWSVVYAATGTINTSDAREKTDVVPLSADELAAASEMARAIGTYQWLASVAEKGADKARHHAGLTVQRAIQIMQSHGLDPFAYGFICYDQWDELPEQWADIPEERDADGNVIREASRELMQEYRPSGDRYSFRTDELLLFMARGFAARLDALEAAQ